MAEIENKKSVELPEQVYSSENGISITRTFKKFFKEFPAAHSLGLRFAARNIKSRYRQSIFGIVWAFLPPLATAFLWILLNESRIVKFSMEGIGPSYPLFVITGTLLWSVFVNSVVMPMNTIQGSRSILVKINFPREALLVNAFYEILFSAAITFVIIIAELIIFRVEVGIISLLFFPALFVLIMFGMSLGLLILPVSLLYSDIKFILPLILQFAMYLTPVIYAKVPYQGAAKLLDLNPITPVLTSARGWLLGIDVSIPLWQVGAVASASVFLILVGIFLQRITLEILIERMGS